MFASAGARKSTKKKWTRGSPDLGFLVLASELFGAASDDSDYVYLSDGGHFENLALYELLRRRCKLIVACDASCDPSYTFADLHNAMERCRTDFGIEIYERNAPALATRRTRQRAFRRVQNPLHTRRGQRL